MSYSTITEADQYIAEHYLSTDSQRLLWEELSDEDKQVLLNQAFDVIEALPLTGHKTDVAQPYAFPRCPDKCVPQEVVNAEIELAFKLSDGDASDEAKEYRRMALYGINSYHIGNFGETVLAYGGQSLAIKSGLISEVSERLLSPWLSGGYNLCPECRGILNSRRL